MQDRHRRQQGGHPRRLERCNDGPVGERARQKRKRVRVLLELGRRRAAPRAVRQHVMA
jgi:hypothetical protein